MRLAILSLVLLAGTARAEFEIVPSEEYRQYNFRVERADEPPARLLTLAEARAEAKKSRRPVVCWINCEPRPGLEEDAVICRSDTGRARVLVGIWSGNNFYYYDTIPPLATPADIRRWIARLITDVPREAAVPERKAPPPTAVAAVRKRSSSC